MLIGIFIPIVLGWTLGATAPRIDTAHTVRLTIEAVDDRTNQPIQAQIRVDCEDRGETPLTLPSLPIHAKISASFEESVWQRVAPDSGAKRTHKLLLHFRSHDPDSSYVMVKGKMVSKICLELRELNRARKRQWDVVKGLQLVESKRRQRCGKAAFGQCKQDLDSIQRLVEPEKFKLAELEEKFDFWDGFCFKPPRDYQIDRRPLYEKVLLESRPTGRFPDPRRYDDAVFSVAELSYKDERKPFFKNAEAHERWRENDSCGIQPLPWKEASTPNDFFRTSLLAHRAYLDSLPEGSRRDIILYRMALLHDLRGEADSGLVYLREVFSLHPSSRLIPATTLRIGNIHYAANRYDSAATWMTSRLDRPGEETKEFPRSRILTLLDSCFLRQPDPLAAARRHFALIGPRPYQDTIFQNLSKQPRKPR